MNPGYPARFDTVKDKTVLSANPCVLTALRVRNGDAAIRYLQLFDRATTGGITLGTTPPDFTILLEGITTADQEVKLGNGLRFTVGIVAAMTTTETGSTLATADSVVVLGKR